MTAPVYKSERAHKFRENFDTPDLAQMHGPVYESGRTHGYTQAEQVVVDQIPLHGPIYDLQVITYLINLYKLIILLLIN